MITFVIKLPKEARQVELRLLIIEMTTSTFAQIKQSIKYNEYFHVEGSEGISIVAEHY
jgi:hypothetical protein